MTQPTQHSQNTAVDPSGSSVEIITSMGKNAQIASHSLKQVSINTIDACLNSLATKIESDASTVIEANKQDLDNAKAKDLSHAMIDRLTITPERLSAIAQSVLSIKELEDPTGQVLKEWTQPNGLRFQKVSVPIGVLGMIYESRPNVTVDAASLCLKSHNAVILRGGSESFYTSQALYRFIQECLHDYDISVDAVQMVQTTDRSMVNAMLQAHEVIDVIIPRGGAGLTKHVMENAKMPVFAHLDGNCHIYIHGSADLDKAQQVIMNAKLRRTGICGAAESLLIDSSLDDKAAKSLLLPLLESDVTIYGDLQVQNLDPRIQSASENDWSKEYLNTEISCKFVTSLEEACTHINLYGSHHTDSILAEDDAARDYFFQNIDSAIVMHNTSTQFADGGEFGMGAEIGIGTGKLHARGPVGLEQLTTFKYCVYGQGHIRA